ncbi:MAG: hypothetical protein WKG32_09350 [Gemmatimonadaceae bacterium]
MNRPTQRSIAPLALASAMTLVVALGGCKSDAGETQDSAAASAAASEAPATAMPADTNAAAMSSGAMAASGAFLDPNAAPREALTAIPGVSAAIADSLVAGRPYADMRGVDRVLGRLLSEAQRDTVYTRLWKPIDLNAATGDEIMLIPGVGARMRHEFEEYRPYTNIERFRREIGKYVKPDEVARLERYVMIR